MNIEFIDEGIKCKNCGEVVNEWIECCSQTIRGWIENGKIETDIEHSETDGIFCPECYNEWNIDLNKIHTHLIAIEKQKETIR